MRLIRLLAAVAFLLVGALVGALNRQPVTLDYAAGSVVVPVGAALLAALFAGVLVGGTAVSLGVVLPLRRRLSRLERGVAPARGASGSGA